MLIDVVYLLIGLIIGSGCTWLITKLIYQKSRGIPYEKFELLHRQYKDLEVDFKVAEQKLNQYAQHIKELRRELEIERNKNVELNKMISSKESDYKNLKEKLTDQKKELESIRQKFTVEFKHLANEILEEKSKKFTDQNKANIGELLNPLKERIEKFETKVEQSNKESLQWNTALKEQIRGLKELNQQMTKEAENLTKALKGDAKTQGTWGEMQLESILEHAGLQKDVHYYKEQDLVNEDGQHQRLDYIIRLPDHKYLVLDSKVSLTAYSNYFNTEDEGQKEQFLKQHLNSLYNHIKVLSEKNYQLLYDITQPDYVMMFVANEPALSIALKEDMKLYESALDKNIVLVSTTTLLATLRTISYIWKQEMQNKNALEIARQAGALYDKFIAFCDDLGRIGKNLDLAQTSYKESMKKLYNGKDNLVRKTERLRELGAKTSKSIDQRLIDQSEE